MKVGIYYNKKHLKESSEYTARIKSFFTCRGIESKVISKISDLDGLDILFVLGGDGTILSVASACAERNIKILGINYGHLGFLTEFEHEKIDDALELVCSNKFSVNRRIMLEVRYRDKCFYALNEFVIQRSTGGQNFSNTVALEAKIDGALIDHYLADGLMVSTPTGSTAYSLSAGGSILSPDLDAFILTPICAHSLHSRPVVFNADSSVTIEPLNLRSPLNVIIDGKIVDTVGERVSFAVEKSKLVAEFISRGDNAFFDKLLIKLSNWSK